MMYNVNVEDRHEHERHFDQYTFSDLHDAVKKAELICDNIFMDGDGPTLEDMPPELVGKDCVWARSTADVNTQVYIDVLRG